MYYYEEEEVRTQYYLPAVRRRHVDLVFTRCMSYAIRRHAAAAATALQSSNSIGHK